MWSKKKTDDDDDDAIHNLERGDHVIRWTHLCFMYPIQVHGIVLSAGDDLVTVCDFGLTATKRQEQHQGNNSEKNDEKQEQEIIESKEPDEQENADFDATTVPLEDMVSAEDRALIQACEEAQDKKKTKQRMNIWTLTDEKEIRKWRKVNYGESLKKQWHWRWWKNNSENSKDKEDTTAEETAATISGDTTTTTASEEVAVAKEATTGSEAINTTAKDSTTTSSSRRWWWKSKETSKVEETATAETATSDDNTTESEELPTTTKDSPTESEEVSTTTKDASTTESEVVTTTSKDDDATTTQPEALLTKSDPATIVLARVRHLLHYPDILPPHHVFFANSECIAVWCKTGRWSTLQASVYLSSTAAGNLKTSIVAASGLAHATTTVTAPAAGIAGWFGFTSTATVSLVSVQPWLIPVFAGFGLITVGTPIALLHACKNRWEKTTMDLNNHFWSLADSDVIIEAIQSWSSIVGV